MSVITPESFPQRSFVYRKLAAAVFTGAAGAAVALSIKNQSSDAPCCGLMDLSVLPRCGFRGPKAATHITALGLPIPGQPNQAAGSDNGDWVLRLSSTEFWLLADLQDHGSRINALSQRDLPERDCYSLYCQDSHAWFALSGAHQAEILAKVCGVDLRAEAFPLGAIAQTSVARVNVIIVHHLIKAVPCFSILSDSASAEYLWESLLDAMAEFGGAVTAAPISAPQ